MNISRVAVTRTDVSANTDTTTLVSTSVSTLTIQRLSKQFAKTPAVRDINLEIQSGEFFSILGPSGCGKTTLLRMIAGFESPTTGSITVDGRDITRTPARLRSIGMVFQNYALFPHMTVFENVAFGLETAGVPKDETRMRVEKILVAVHLSGKMHIPVPTLSGGEQQRVAVARALVVEPTVLLFDEPLSNLDVSLRWKTREEIRSLQRKTEITTVYVTHDQSEAMSLSDRIAVMNDGKIEQVGTPVEIYEHPASSFIAQFVGGANMVRGMYSKEKKTISIETESFELLGGSRDLTNGHVTVCIKPEAIAISLVPGKGMSPAIVQAKEYLGFTTNFLVETWGVQLRVSSMSSEMTERISPGMEVSVSVDWSRCSIFRDN